MFKIQKAKKEKVFTKIALMSPSGGGKTYSSLRLATGMKTALDKIDSKQHKILMANTEGSRGRYYANEFDYDIVDLVPPYNPEQFAEVINFAVQEGYDILIMDSTSPEWEGPGGCLELQQRAGGTYQAWGKVTPRHQKFIDALVQSDIHIIATMRGKDQYEVEKDDRGKTSVKKLGVGAKQRDGFEYEFTCTFLLDSRTHMAEVQKDNTHIFKEMSTLLSEQHGEGIIQWANSDDASNNSDIKATKAEISPEEKLKNTKKEIIDLANAIYRTNPGVMDVVKKYEPGGNPNAIKSQEQADNLLAELKQM